MDRAHRVPAVSPSGHRTAAEGPANPADTKQPGDSSQPGRLLAEAQAAEALFRGLVESAPDGIVITDRTGRINLVNGKIEDMFGFERGELIGQPIEVLIPERFRTRHIRERDAYNSSPHMRPMGLGFELYGRRKDGSEFPVEISLGPVPTGDDLLVTAIVRDVTQQRLIQERVARQARMLELVPTAVFTRDLGGGVTYWNKAAEDLYGWAAEQAMGQVSHALLQTRFPEPREAIEAAVLREGTWSGELVHTRRDGTQIVVDSRWALQLSPSGQPTGYLEINTDITDSKRAAEHLQTALEELERSNRELELFAYMASHDLQEPLRMVASYTQLLRRRYQGKLDQDADEFIDYAVDGARRMQALINDLLAYSRVGTQGQPFVRVSMREALGRVLGDLQPAIEEQHAQVTYDEDLPDVLADPSQVHQLLQNLVGNALKYHDPERASRVHLSVAKDAGCWRFAVSDNGIGIEPQYAERIFVLFQRLHTRAAYSGTGIGLAICKKIVERHGGHIWVESTPGDGSTFFFTLPPTDKQHAARTHDHGTSGSPA
jgi:PAS domain S-box-containing protein